MDKSARLQRSGEIVRGGVGVAVEVKSVFRVECDIGGGGAKGSPSPSSATSLPSCTSQIRTQPRERPLWKVTSRAQAGEILPASGGWSILQIPIKKLPQLQAPFATFCKIMYYNLFSSDA